MPLRDDIKKVLVIGSGPIVIGQAAEFDYSGTQACKALKEEGFKVILVNSNPATIMTDEDIADRVYIEPLKSDYIAKIIEKEKPGGFLPTLGGQTGLNLAVELAESGVLESYGVSLLGTSMTAIKKAEDRELFRILMDDINEPVVENKIVRNFNQAVNFVKKVGFPLIVRPAYTLGGSGGGIASNKEELYEILQRGLKRSRINQVIVERSIAGWKELEYEVIRDGADNCITVCNMENIDPVGIHTGDSIVVAPSQTLTDKEYHLLRSVSIKIIRALKIEGGCNIQFALDPTSQNYYVIEVNPRVSRSSALASKATGYPIAQVSAKIALGLHLDEIKNSVTGNTPVCFEPALDYVVSKIPRWPFDKFDQGDRILGSQMKATGEVMAIGRNFTESFLKAVESLDLKLPELMKEQSEKEIRRELMEVKDNRIFFIIWALFNNISPEIISRISGVDLFYLYKFKEIVDMGEVILKGDRFTDNYNRLIEAKRLGFSDKLLAQLSKCSEKEIRDYRKEKRIENVYKMVDTCAAEFAASTPYYYSSFDQEDEVEISNRKKVIVLGSGPIRIGQGIEFDYSSVHAVKALQQEGIEAIIINNNPETVSTDFDIADKLYFEPLTFEYVQNVIEKENCKDLILQFGGQTAINLAEALAGAGANILGTELENINLAEDRKQFNQILNSNEIPTPPGITVYNKEEAWNFTRKIGFPALVRPSFVLGGRGMEIVYNKEELMSYLEEAFKLSPRHPVLIDSYIYGQEIEVDAIADGEEVLIPGIMEHIERAGIHSGDSMAVYPPQDIPRNLQQQLVSYTRKIVKILGIKGLVNIQFVIDDQGNIYVLEVNPRASRTVPILSKVTEVPMVSLAVQIMLGKKLKDLTPLSGLLPPSEFVSIKIPIFSFDKLSGIDIHLAPEMKSTGEVLGTAESFEKAVYKALLAADFSLPEGGNILFSLADRDKVQGLELAGKFLEKGFKVLATEKTAAFFERNGLSVKAVVDPVNFIRENKIDMVINTPTKGKDSRRKGFKIRRTAVEYNIPCFTALDTMEIVIHVLFNDIDKKEMQIYHLGEYYRPFKR